MLTAYDDDFSLFDERTINHTEPIWVQYGTLVPEYLIEQDKAYLESTLISIRTRLIHELLDKITDNTPMVIKFVTSVRPNPQYRQVEYKVKLLYKLVDSIEQVQYSARLSKLDIAKWPDNFFWKAIWHEIKNRIKRRLRL